jgi:ribosomal protein S18 acetylase RimI-like enzyme
MPDLRRGVISFRRYLNSDPPGLVDVWNDAATGRGAFPIRSAIILDKWVLSKTFFDPEALTVAEEISADGKKQIVGFSLAGFGPNEDLTALSKRIGTTCILAVRKSHRKQGIGKELLKRSEEYLAKQGAEQLVFGSMNPVNPYLFGIYGGANSPGVLKTDVDAEPFLLNQNYAVGEGVSIFQRKLDGPLDIVDSRFNFLRRRYDVQLIRVASVVSWWAECVWGILEPVEFRAYDKLTGMPCARAIVWEMEGFNWRWNVPAAGILDVQVRPDLRRQGLAKMLVFQILRFLQDQFFGIAELQVRSADPGAVGLCKGLGFEKVDEGFMYVKKT